MTTLTTEQLIYLLYAKAYAKASEASTVTKGSMKTCLPSECKKKAEKIYDVLKQQGLIELKTKDGKTTDKNGNSITKDGRFSITDQGNQALVANLTTTNYDFTASKSYKVLGTALTSLLRYVKEMPEFSPGESSEEMTFEEFQEKFKTLYFEERRQQELQGAVAIYSRKLLQKFSEQYSISNDKLEQYFDLLKKERKIFTVTEKEHEFMEWAE